MLSDITLHVPRRPDHRHHRQHRVGQDDPGQPRGPALRRDRRRGARRRRRRPRPRPRAALAPHRARAAEALPVLRHRRQQPPLRQARRHRRRDVGGARGRAGDRLRRGHAGGLDGAIDPGRRRTCPAASASDWPSPAPSCAARDLPLRRLVLGARPRHRRPPASRARAVHAGRDRHHRGPACVDDLAAPTRSSCSRTARRSASARTTSSWRPARPTPRSSSRRSARGGGVTHRTATTADAGGQASGAPPGPGPGMRWGSLGMPIERSSDFGTSHAAPGSADSSAERLGIVVVLVLAVVSVAMIGARPEDPRARHRRHRRGVMSPTGIDFGALHRILACRHRPLRAGSAALAYRHRLHPRRRSCSARCTGCGPTSRTSSTACRCGYVDRNAAWRPAQPGHQRHRQHRPEPPADAQPDAHLDADAHRRRHR